MGTRHLTIVRLDGEYKIAQYGQFDGYPAGQGMTALAFARKLSDPDIKRRFVENVRKCSWITQVELDEISMDDDWRNIHPELSRDTGADILQMVYDSDNGLSLWNRIEFAANSLFCEWAWLIDLDFDTFEGYKGFNDDSPLSIEDRFYYLRDKEHGAYHAIKMKALWDLNSLPSDEEFLAEFNTNEE